MTITQAILLGLLQGFTEFLPVSSSGHLVLAQELMNISHEGDISFEVFVHFGTLLSVLGAMRKDIWEILQAVVGGLKRPRDMGRLYKHDQFFRLGVFIFVGSIPATIIGLNYKLQVEEFFADPKLVGVMLLITGFVLYLTRFASPRDDARVGLGSAIIIGCAQAAAIIPGISRSGSTISAGLFAGVSRENSARFSFLMAVPVILGATVIETSDMLVSAPSSEKLLALSVGTCVAAISGYLAIEILLDVLRRQRFSWFSYYCFIAGMFAILFIG